jgi:hypothetical protein
VCTCEARALLKHMGNRLGVGPALGAVGGLPGVEAGCVGADESVARDELDKSG